MSRQSLLKMIIIISTIAVIAMPTYVIMILEPSFTDYITQETEAEAIQVGTHMASIFFDGPQNITESNLPSNLHSKMNRLQKEFNIVKVKIFDEGGKIIYSTSRKDIGTINTKPYFTQKVSQGKVFTKTVQKSARSLEDQTMTVDVVETYVPIMKNLKFAGAFEIYYDITNTKNKLIALLLKGKQTSMALTFALLLALFFTAIQAHRSILREKIAEEEIKKTNENLEDRVTMRTKELNEANDSMQQEIIVRKEIETEREELICELQTSIEQVKTLRGLLPICSSCQQIRDDKGKWNKIDEYIQEHTEVKLTHGICPDCAQRLYPDLYANIKTNG